MMNTDITVLLLKILILQGALLNSKSESWRVWLFMQTVSTIAPSRYRSINLNAFKPGQIRMKRISPGFRNFLADFRTIVSDRRTILAELHNHTCRVSNYSCRFANHYFRLVNDPCQVSNHFSGLRTILAGFWTILAEEWTIHADFQIIVVEYCSVLERNASQVFHLTGN